MSLLRNVLTDLVDKKLWPVAVALLAALVAVPVVLGGGGSDADQPLPVPGAASVPGTTPAVTAAEDTVNGAGVPRAPHDPFAKRDVPSDETTAPTASGAVPAEGSVPAVGASVPVGGGSMPSGGTTASSGSSSGGGSTSWSPSGADAIPVDVTGLDDVDVVPADGGSSSDDDGGSLDTKETDDTTETSDRDTWHVGLRVGREGELKSRTDVARLTPLPSEDDPALVFLGIAADGKTALFLVSSDAKVTGDGTCQPSPKDCERIEMQEGDAQVVEAAGKDGKIVRYGVELERITRERAATAAVARAARTRESDTGRRVLRAAVRSARIDISGLAYSRGLGLVLPTAEAAASPLFGGFRVDLRAGAPGHLVERTDLARLTPLPSADTPQFVFLGVLADGRTALFLNPTAARPRGDAGCEPSADMCQRVKLREGDHVTFDAPRPGGGTTPYDLAIDWVTPVEARSGRAARALRLRESKVGRKVLRRLLADVGSLVENLSFSGGRGVVAEGK